MINKVMFVGKFTAETIGPFEDWAVISIGESDMKAPQIKDGWHDVLRLFFHDVNPDKVVDLTNTYKYVGMSESQANQIVEFVNRVAPNVDGILVHCKAGISRSAAVAEWIAKRYELPFDYSYPNSNSYVLRLIQESEHRSGHEKND